MKTKPKRTLRFSVLGKKGGVCHTHTDSSALASPAIPGLALRGSWSCPDSRALESKAYQPSRLAAKIFLPPTSPQKKKKKEKERKENLTGDQSAKDGVSLGRSEIAREKTLLASTK